MKQYRVLTINPGSTSTKIALFEGETCLFSKNVAHDAQELAKFKTIPDQLRQLWAPSWHTHLQSAMASRQWSSILRILTKCRR